MVTTCPQCGAQEEARHPSRTNSRGRPRPQRALRMRRDAMQAGATRLSAVACTLDCLPVYTLRPAAPPRNPKMVEHGAWWPIGWRPVPQV